MHNNSDSATTQNMAGCIGDTAEEKSSVEVHTFNAEIGEMPVLFQVLKLENTVFIWCGNLTNPEFSDLIMAMKTKYENVPTSTRLMGDSCETASSFASRLSQKLGKVVYISYNLPPDKFLMPAVEKKVIDEIKSHPYKF